MSFARHVCWHVEYANIARLIDYYTSNIWKYHINRALYVKRDMDSITMTCCVYAQIHLINQIAPNSLTESFASYRLKWFPAISRSNQKWKRSQHSNLTAGHHFEQIWNRILFPNQIIRNTFRKTSWIIFQHPIFYFIWRKLRDWPFHFLILFYLFIYLFIYLFFFFFGGGHFIRKCGFV